MPYLKTQYDSFEKAIMAQNPSNCLCTPQKARKITLLGGAPHKQVVPPIYQQIHQKCHPFSNMPNMQYAYMKPKAFLLKDP
jgi:hypothetical protein